MSENFDLWPEFGETVLNDVNLEVVPRMTLPCPECLKSVEWKNMRAILNRSNNQTVIRVCCKGCIAQNPPLDQTALSDDINWISRYQSDNYRIIDADQITKLAILAKERQIRTLATELLQKVSPDQLKFVIDQAIVESIMKS